VKIRDGPAAVTGTNATNINHCLIFRWEGVVSRMNRESEDLPKNMVKAFEDRRPANNNHEENRESPD